MKSIELNQAELIALHKAIMFAKFPDNDDSRYEIAGSTISNNALNRIRTGLGWSQKLNLTDHPECLISVKKALINVGKHDLSAEIKRECYDAIIFPFSVDKELEAKLLVLVGVSA